MEMDYYKQRPGKDEEKTSLTECIKIAAGHGLTERAAVAALCDTVIGMLVFDDVKLWSEEAIHERKS